MTAPESSESGQQWMPGSVLSPHLSHLLVLRPGGITYARVIPPPCPCAQMVFKFMEDSFYENIIHEYKIFSHQIFYFCVFWASSTILYNLVIRVMGLEGAVKVIFCSLNTSRLIILLPICHLAKNQETTSIIAYFPCQANWLCMQWTDMSFAVQEWGGDPCCPEMNTHLQHSSPTRDPSWLCTWPRCRAPTVPEPRPECWSLRVRSFQLLPQAAQMNDCFETELTLSQGLNLLSKLL